MENTELVKEFGDLLSIGGVTRTVKLGSHEIILRTLSFDEQSGIMNSMPEDARRLDGVQKELLASSIKTIDGKEFKKEDIKFLLGKSQASLCNMLFAEYETLIEEQSRTLDDIKKNSLGLTKKIP